MTTALLDMQGGPAATFLAPQSKWRQMRKCASSEPAENLCYTLTLADQRSVYVVSVLRVSTPLPKFPTSQGRGSRVHRARARQLIKMRPAARALQLLYIYLHGAGQ